MPVLGHDSDRTDHAAFVVRRGDAARADDRAVHLELVQLGQPARQPAVQVRGPAFKHEMRAVVLVAALEHIEHRARIARMDIRKAALQRRAAVDHVIRAFGRAADQILQRLTLRPVGIDLVHLHAPDQVGDRGGVGALVGRDGQHAVRQIQRRSGLTSLAAQVKLHAGIAQTIGAQRGQRTRAEDVFMRAGSGKIRGVCGSHRDQHSGTLLSLYILGRSGPVQASSFLICER